MHLLFICISIFKKQLDERPERHRHTGSLNPIREKKTKNK